MMRAIDPSICQDYFSGGSQAVAMLGGKKVSCVGERQFERLRSKMFQVWG